MARIRSIKPEFWDDRKLAKRTSRDARLLYIGLWNTADEHARLNGDPQWIKGQLFAFDDDLNAAGVDKLLAELEALGSIVRYEADEDPYIFLPKLSKHQRLDAAKVRSRLPPPPEAAGMGPEPDNRPPAVADRLPFETAGLDESGPGTDKYGRDPDETKPGPDSSRSGPDKPALLYVAGSREHVSREQGAGSAPAPAADRGTVLTADRLLTEHRAALPCQPAKETVRETGQMIDRLLAEKTPEDVIREALARWRTKPKYGPGLLPRLVKDVLDERADAGPGATRSRASPRGHQAYRNPSDQSGYDEEARPA